MLIFTARFCQAVWQCNLSEMVGFIPDMCFDHVGNTEEKFKTGQQAPKVLQK